MTRQSIERRLSDLEDPRVDGYPVVSLAVVLSSEWECVDPDRHLYRDPDGGDAHHCPALAEILGGDDDG